MFFLGVAFLGVYAFSRIGVDLLPNINLPHLTVQTTYPNSGPEEVEKLVTNPLESAVGTLKGIKKVTSVSREGLSVILIDYLWGTDMNMAILSLREKLDNIRFALPREAGRPTIVQSDPSASPVMSVSVSYANSPFGKQSFSANNFVTEKSPYPEIKRLIDLKDAAKVIFKRRLEQLNGVAQAVVTGGLEREILIEAEPEKLSQYDVSFSEIQNALRSSNINMPAGSVMKGLFRYSLKMHGEFKNIGEIKRTVVKHFETGRTLYLSDVADVKEGFTERTGLTRFNGEETVGLLIYKEPSANTVTVSKQVRKAIESLSKQYPRFNLVVVSDQSEFIRKAISNVKQSIFYGGILAVIVLFLFLGSLRNIVVIALSIPASLVLTVFLMFLFGINFNVISLGGIAVGVGMLLDNAIIVTENIVRHKEGGANEKLSAVRGAEEVSMPIVASTLTTLAVFVPLLFIKGIAGALFKDQSYAIIFSLGSSVLVAITLIPMLASRKALIIRKKTHGNISPDPRLEGVKKFFFYLKYPFKKFWALLKFLIAKSFDFALKYFSSMFGKFFSIAEKQLDFLMRKYEHLLNLALNNRMFALFITLLFLVIASIIAFNIKKEFIPPAPRNEFTVKITYPPGTSLKGNAQFTAKLEKAFLNIPYVRYIVSNIGRVNSFDLFNKTKNSVAVSTLTFKLDSYENYYAVRKKLEKMLDNLGRLKYSFQPVKTTYSELINPAEDDIIVKIKDKNLPEAYLTGELLLDSVKSANLKGITDFRFGVNKATPQYNLTISRDKCGYYGINVEDVANAIVNIAKGNIVTSFSDFNKKINIKLTSLENNKNDIDKLLNNYVNIEGKNILLKDLVSYYLTEGFNEIWHENQARTVFMYANVNGISISDAVEKIKNVVKKIPLRQGEIISIGGANKEIKSSFNKLYIALIISLFLVYMVLAMEFESFLFPFIIILSIPLGMIGGIIALALFGQSLNVISLIGLIVLMGIANNDAVVKVEFIMRKRSEGLPMREAIILAGKERFRPIVMTSITTIFGLLPMIVFAGAGSQLRTSLSITIAGGLVTSTLLTLIIIPVIYSLLERFSLKQEFYSRNLKSN